MLAYMHAALCPAWYRYSYMHLDVMWVNFRLSLGLWVWDTRSFG